MGTQLIEYSYSGDEQAWQTAIKDFLQNISNDPLLEKNFSYQVFVREDGTSRVHLPVWQNEQTLTHLKAQPFFAKFTSAVQGFAGDTLHITKPTYSSTS